jgi:uncharacterized membrane protein
MAHVGRVEAAAEERDPAAAAGWLTHGFILSCPAKVLPGAGRSAKIEPAAMRYLIAIFALVGLVVSSLALQVHYSNGTEPCSINEKWDCGIVNHSSFAVIGHIPVAAIGMAGYLLLAILALARCRRLVVAGALLGLGFALYLSHVERDILQVWCLYCVISQGIIALLTLISLGWLIAEETAKLRGKKLA